MIGVTEPPFTCDQCGFTADSLTAISQHDTEHHQESRRKSAAHFPATVWRAGIGLVPAAHDTPDYRPKPRTRPKPVPQLGRISAGTIQASIIEAARITVIPPGEQSPAHRHDPPPVVMTDEPEEVREPWSWYKARVWLFVKLFALEDAWLGRHNKKRIKREREHAAKYRAMAQRAAEKEAARREVRYADWLRSHGDLLRLLADRRPSQSEISMVDHSRALTDRKAS